MADMDDVPTQCASNCSAAGASTMDVGDDTPETDNQDGAQSSGPTEEESGRSAVVVQGENHEDPPLRDNPSNVSTVNNDPKPGPAGGGESGDASFKAPTLPSKAGSKSNETSQKENPASRQAADSVCPYTEPPWAGIPEQKYTMEILKNGKIIDTIDLNTKSFHVFGRLKSCDIPMEHPSLSRFHAVLQYCAVNSEKRDVGWYLYDLDSTHGTWINKNQVHGKIFYRIRVGHVVKFGGSTRLHILQGPPDDEEPESELSLTELQVKREEKKKAAKLSELAQEQEGEDEGNQECSWGMGEDAVEEEAPFQMSEFPQNEHLYVDDPKKALKNFFEREGWDLPDYQLFDAGFGKHRCVVELPVDTPSGEPVCAEVTVSGKRKEAVLACALEACRTLDRMGELCKSHQQSRKKKAKNWEDNDFYGSDDDEFLDRTGSIEQKRALRMKKAGKLEKPVETFESLSKKLLDVQTDIYGIEKQLEAAKSDSAGQESEEVDALDAFMSAIKSGTMDTKTRLTLKRRLFEQRKEEQRLQKLVNIARPATLPTSNKVLTGKATAKLPMFGKIKGRSKPLKVAPRPIPKPAERHDGSQEEEEEEEDPVTTVVPQGSPNNQNKPMNTDKSGESHVPESDKDNQNNDLSKSPVSSQAEVMPATGETKSRNISEKRTSMNSVADSLQRAKDASSEETAHSTRPAPHQEKTSRESLGSKSAAKKRSVESTTETLKKLKKPRGPTKPEGDYDNSDPNFAVWMPPKDQTGDGRTHLNDKFGY